jgi:hypothetical protein
MVGFGMTFLFPEPKGKSLEDLAREADDATLGICRS